MSRAALNTDDQPGNWLSWDGLMQAAYANFLQTPLLTITGECRDRIKILGSKISCNMIHLFPLNI